MSIIPAPDLRGTDQVQDSECTDISALLAMVVAFYERTHGVGHTRCLFSGLGYPVHISTVAPKPTVVASTELTARYLNSASGIALSQFGKLKSKRVALIWDNSAIHQLAALALARINELEAALARANEHVQVIEDEEAPKAAVTKVIVGSTPYLLDNKDEIIDV